MDAFVQREAINAPTIAGSLLARLDAAPEDAAEVVWRGRTFVSHKTLHFKGGRKRTSWISQYGYYVREYVTGGSNHSSNSKDWWICTKCDHNRLLEPGHGIHDAKVTTNAIDHLRRSHRITAPTLTPDLDDDDDTDDSNPLKRSRSSRASTPSIFRTISKHEAARLEGLVVGFIVTSNSPFGVFDNPCLKALLLALNPGIPRQLSLSRGSIRKHIIDIYSTACLLIKEALSIARSKIHLEFDL